MDHRQFLRRCGLREEELSLSNAIPHLTCRSRQRASQRSNETLRCTRQQPWWMSPGLLSSIDSFKIALFEVFAGETRRSPMTNARAKRRGFADNRKEALV